MFESIFSLPLERKVGQLLMIGIAGPEVDKATAEILEEISPGGICLFARNIKTLEQIRQLNEELRAKLPVEPIISIDQEGGLVDRLRRVITPMPSARAVQQSGDLGVARKLGSITGRILRILGFNLNLAPVIEVLSEEREFLSHGLYSRSFGRSSGEVFGYAMAYLQGLQNEGIWGCLKHFPGLGAGNFDSHDEIPIITLSLEELMAKDLAPYLEFFLSCRCEAARVRAVMIGHGAYPKVDLTEDGKLLPASINKNIINLLRGELGYKNLILTDDLEMGAITRHYSVEDAARMAFEAGEDMILICSNAELIYRTYKSLLSAIKNKEISQQRLVFSLRRIAKMKSVLRQPLEFDKKRLLELSDEVTKLNEKLNYRYGG